MTSILQNKKILLGVCGGIAAYKIATLIRLLVKEGAQVQVVMTPEATQFITPLTLSTLSKRPVIMEYHDIKSGEWENHVEWGLWGDCMLVAPLTANTLAKFANGLCDNILSAIYLSSRCQVYLAPAMDLDMWKHGAVKRNIALVESFGNSIISPGSGELASGLTGQGRLAEPGVIVEFLRAEFERKGANCDGNDDEPSSSALLPPAPPTHLPLLGKTALVTSGGTREALDPVRFIGNRSSGKMGYAIATKLMKLGATVTLITGPNSLPAPDERIKLIKIESAREMLKEVCGVAGIEVPGNGESGQSEGKGQNGQNGQKGQHGQNEQNGQNGQHGQNCSQGAPKCDIIVMAAAVADYTPITVATTKIKKPTQLLDQNDQNNDQHGQNCTQNDNPDGLTIRLKKTVDILATLGLHKSPTQTLMGFALETDNELENAIGKLKRKNASFIVLNSMRDPGAGFDTDTNKVTVVTARARVGAGVGGDVKDKREKEQEHEQETGIIEFSLKKKDDVAVDLCRIIVEHQNQINVKEEKI